MVKYHIADVEMQIQRAHTALSSPAFFGTISEEINDVRDLLFTLENILAYRERGSVKTDNATRNLQIKMNEFRNLEPAKYMEPMYKVLSQGGTNGSL